MVKHMILKQFRTTYFTLKVAKWKQDRQKVDEIDKKTDRIPIAHTQLETI